MATIKEVVLELCADDLMNGAGSVHGRIVRVAESGVYQCCSDRHVSRVPFPDQSFGSLDEAREALIDYWLVCDRKTTEGPYYWSSVT
ncbi:hypothetical protein E8E95_05570 [Pseudomonas sp. BN414]|uniref:hypothetical protein n=1 Tax=Pseudomonas sp. BN414 TaxID=2567888 RepID=UPI002454552C|nr:hypothetical protein [Pseudomonas sp. BN414]MDH4566141.1 hypothetical protein [Pseudomonas sp. BN414]